MHNPLSERCFKALVKDVFLTEYATILKTLLVEHESIQPLVEKRLTQLTLKKVESEEHLLEALKEFQILLLLGRFSFKLEGELYEKCVSFFHTLKFHPYAYDHVYAHIFLKLIAVLLNQDDECFSIRALPSGFVQEGVKGVS